MGRAGHCRAWWKALAWRVFVDWGEPGAGVEASGRRRSWPHSAEDGSGRLSRSSSKRNLHAGLVTEWSGSRRRVASSHRRVERARFIAVPALPVLGAIRRMACAASQTVAESFHPNCDAACSSRLFQLSGNCNGGASAAAFFGPSISRVHARSVSGGMAESSAPGSVSPSAVKRIAAAAGRGIDGGRRHSRIAAMC